jgi:6-pyruvoyltetrahydropterin/6-carboxytetrahydropterin synthase
MYTIIVRGKFDSAHFLPGYNGKCANVHGHTWRVEVEYTHAVVDAQGMAEDFVLVKARLNAILDKLDHKLLNDIKGLSMPTAENLAKYLYTELKASKVTVWESDNAGVSYVD